MSNGVPKVTLVRVELLLHGKLRVARCRLKHEVAVCAALKCVPVWNPVRIWVPRLRKSEKYDIFKKKAGNESYSTMDFLERKGMERH